MRAEIEGMTPEQIWARAEDERERELKELVNLTHEYRRRAARNVQRSRGW